MSPERATPFHSPGRKPWVNCCHHILSSVGAALSQRMQSHEPQRHKPNTRSVSAAPTELNPRLSTCTQGSISGFALIPPWAMKKCRAYGTHDCIAQ